MLAIMEPAITAMPTSVSSRAAPVMMRRTAVKIIIPPAANISAALLVSRLGCRLDGGEGYGDGDQIQEAVYPLGDDADAAGYHRRRNLNGDQGDYDCQ